MSGLPERFGPYTLLRQIGRGGMGEVFDALSPWGERIALKLTRVFVDPAQAAHIAMRFQREALLLAQLDHPGVVPLRDAGLIDDLVYLALARIEGATLRAIRERGPLPLDVVARLGIRIAQTLAHVHDAGVVHRDIKPGNVLVDTRGRPVLIDFGIATAVDATRITNRHDILGTLGYIAPEVVEGGTGDALADQYSLGRVLFELAAANTPKDRSGERDERMLAGLKVDWSAFPGGAAWTSLQIVVQRMVAQRPEQRYPDLSACAAALVAVSKLDEARTRDADDQLILLARSAGDQEALGLAPRARALATTAWGRTNQL